MNNKRAVAGALAALGLASGLAVFSPSISVAEPSAKFQTTIPIAYVNERGARAAADAYQLVDASTAELAKGWYVVERDTQLSGGLRVTGDARLILERGATLTVSGGMTLAKGAKLTLYAQDAPASAAAADASSIGELVVQGGIKWDGSSAASESAKSNVVVFGEPAPLKVAVCADVQAGDSAEQAAAVEDWTTQGDWCAKAYVRVRPLASHAVFGTNGVDDGVCAVCGAAVRASDALVEVTDLANTTSSEAQVSEAQASEANDLATFVDESAVVANQDPAVPLTAQAESSVTITFDANGGTGSMANIETTAGTSFVLPECTFTPPAGKVFETWSMGNPGDSVSVPISTTIRAFWKADTSSGSGSSSSTPTNTTTPTTSTTPTTPTSTTTSTTSAASDRTPATADVQSPAAVVTLAAAGGLFLVFARRTNDERAHGKRAHTRDGQA